MMLSKNRTVNLILMLVGGLVAIIIFVVAILYVAGFFSAKLEEEKNIVPNFEDYRTAIAQSAKSFDVLRSDFAKDYVNFGFFELESFKRVYSENLPGCTSMFPLLACHQYCDHIYNTIYDSETQKLSIQVQEFLKQFTNSEKISSGAQIYNEIYYEYRETFGHFWPYSKEDIVSFFDYLLQNFRQEEESLPLKPQYFVQDGIKTNRHLSHIRPNLLRLIYRIDINAENIAKPISELFVEQIFHSSISATEKNDDQEVREIYGKYLMISISGAEFDDKEKNIGKKILLSDMIAIEGHTYLPKIVVCHQRKINGEFDNFHFELLLFTSNSCLKFSCGRLCVITTQEAFEIAFERSLAVIYERMD